MDKRIILIGVLLVFLPLIIILPGLETKKVIKPCVDGNLNVNLEGFMCEGSEEIIYGINSIEFVLPLTLFMLLGFVFVGVGLLK